MITPSVVHYDEPFAPGLASWTLTQMPRHLLEGKDVRASKLNRHPIGTGPYEFVRWDPGARVVLRYFKDYFMGRSHIAQVTYRVIPDMATMFLELKSGGLDWMGLTALQYRRQTENAFFKKNFVKVPLPLLRLHLSGLQPQRPPLCQDKRVRQALSYAIDTKGDHQGGAPGPGPGVHRTHQAGHLLVQPQGAALSLRPGQGQGAFSAGGMERS